MSPAVSPNWFQISPIENQSTGHATYLIRVRTNLTLSLSRMAAIATRNPGPMTSFSLVDAGGATQTSGGDFGTPDQGPGDT